MSYENSNKERTPVFGLDAISIYSSLNSKFSKKKADSSKLQCPMKNGGNLEVKCFCEGNSTINYKNNIQIIISRENISGEQDRIDTTNKDGIVKFLNIPPGTYTINIYKDKLHNSKAKSYNEVSVYVPNGGTEKEEIELMDYWRFDTAIEYMYKEMKKNPKTKIGQEMIALNKIAAKKPTVEKMAEIALIIAKTSGKLIIALLTGNPALVLASVLPDGDDPALTAKLKALYKWFSMVRENEPWDHKSKLRKSLKLTRPWIEQWLAEDIWFPIRGDCEYEYNYDIWSNIHYGYVGRAVGFGGGILKFAHQLNIPGITGGTDKSDVSSVNIGIKLWDDYGDKLTQEQLHIAILTDKHKLNRDKARNHE